MYTHVSMAFIVSIAYDPRNKFHYCMSKFLQVRSWTYNMTVYKQPAVLSLFYPYNKCNANIDIWNKVIQILNFCNGGHLKNSYWQLSINTQNFMQMLTCRPKFITILSFKWWPFWKFLMTAITIIRWYVLTFCMICYIAGHQYTQFHVNIHMQTKVISILNFRWWPFLFF